MIQLNFLKEYWLQINLLDVAMNAIPQMMLHTHPQIMKTHSNCRNANNMQMQNDMKISPEDIFLLSAQQKTLHPARKVPKMVKNNKSYKGNLAAI